jgi:hypothetical protein
MGGEEAALPDDPACGTVQQVAIRVAEFVGGWLKTDESDEFCYANGQHLDGAGSARLTSFLPFFHDRPSRCSAARIVSRQTVMWNVS